LGNNTVKEILAVNGVIPASPTVIQLGSGLEYPYGIAVDSSGDLFVADTFHQAIKEFVAVNGSIPPSPTILTIGSGWSSPEAIAVDATGNLYVADSGNHAVKEILAVNGSIPASPTIVTLAANYCSPDGVSLDSQGNLYFSSYCDTGIYEILAVNGTFPASPFIKTISGAGEGRFTSVTVDSNENIYVGGVFSETQVPQVYPSDLGPVRIGTTAGVTPLTFTFIGPVTLGSVSVVTQGAVGMDFADAGTGTCVAGGYYNSPSGYSLCTVNVTFTPEVAGARFGAVLLKDTGGKVIVTGYMQGTGVGPRINFAPPTQNTVISNVPWNQGVALDGSGNLYVSLPNSNQVVKETLSGGSFTQSVLPTSALSGPIGVAVDGGGSIYIADTGNGRVLKETASQSGYVENIVAAYLNIPVGVAVDGNGIVYIICENGQLLVETPSFGSYNNLNTISTGLTSASGIAVDGVGNIYIVSNTTNGSVLRLSANSYAQTTIPVPSGGVPTGVALDSWGNLYITYVVTGGPSQILKEVPSAGGYTQATIPTSGLNEPFAVAVDQSGNLFVADSGNYRILKLDAADPPRLSFADTPLGSTSSDSPQTITLENVGNADLNFPIPANGNNPSISLNFTLDENAPSACAVTGSGSSTAGLLAAGTSCVLPISFAPTTAGNLNGSLVLTDNNLNAAAPAYATQSISLTGTATPRIPTISWPPPAAIIFGTQLSTTQLNATANVPGTFSYSPATGVILTAGTKQLTATFTPSDTTDYTTATASVPLTVNRATPTITWPAPTPISYGTPLTSTQLNATANVPGSFVYNPAAGTVLPAGTNTLHVTLTPTDNTDYNNASASVSLMVNAPGFSITASPASVSVKQGAKVSSTISISPTGGFSSNVSLSASGLPKGVTAAFSPNPTKTASTITFTANGGASLTTSTLTVTGKSGTLTQTTGITLTVTHK
jgi:sugar lactone lactonase YvrE